MILKLKKISIPLVFYRDNGFQTIGNSTIGNGIGYVKSIVYHGMENREQPLPYTLGEVNDEEIFKEKKEYLNAIFEFKEVEEPVAAILSPIDLINFEAVNTTNITALVNVYPGSKLFLSILLFINS